MGRQGRVRRRCPPNHFAWRPSVTWSASRWKSIGAAGDQSQLAAAWPEARRAAGQGRKQRDLGHAIRSRTDGPRARGDRIVVGQTPRRPRAAAGPRARRGHQQGNHRHRDQVRGPKTADPLVHGGDGRIRRLRHYDSEEAAEPQADRLAVAPPPHAADEKRIDRPGARPRREQGVRRRRIFAPAGNHVRIDARRLEDGRAVGREKGLGLTGGREDAGRRGCIGPEERFPRTDPGVGRRPPGPPPRRPRRNSILWLVSHDRFKATAPNPSSTTSPTSNSTAIAPRRVPGAGRIRFGQTVEARYMTWICLLFFLPEEPPGRRQERAAWIALALIS